jgi:hypothetical protein
LFVDFVKKMADYDTSPRRGGPPDNVLSDFVQLMDLYKLPDEGNEKKR